MRKKIKYDGNVAIILAIVVSAILLVGGIIYKKSKGLEEYTPMAAEKKEDKEEKKKNINLKTENIVLLCKDKTGLQSLDFIEMDYEKNRLLVTNYPKELLVKENEEFIKLERLYIKNKSINKKIIENNFDKKDFIYLQIDLDKAKNVLTLKEKEYIDEIFIDSQDLEEGKNKKLQESFKLINGKFQNKEEVEKFFKELKDVNNKSEIQDNKVKIIKLDEIIDNKAMSILQGDEKNIKIAYRNEDELKAYKGYIDIKNKEKKKLEEIENTNETTNKKSIGNKVNTNNINSINTNNINNVTKPDDEENLNNNVNSNENNSNNDSNTVHENNGDSVENNNENSTNGVLDDIETKPKE